MMAKQIIHDFGDARGWAYSSNSDTGLCNNPQETWMPICEPIKLVEIKVT